MLQSILLGLPLAFATLAVQAMGTVWWIGRLGRNAKSFSADRTTSWKSIQILCLTGCFLLSLHLAEVTIWAIAYLMLPAVENVQTFEEACYFSAVTFTSLGYGDIVISSNWRILSTIQAMVGLFVFGWSTALIFAILQRILLSGTKVA